MAVTRVEGLRELERALKELPKATARNVLKRGLMAAAEPVVNDAEARAPLLKGTLKASIDASDRLTRRQKARHKKESAVEVFVGAGGLPQAHLQEFGTADHAAQPFLRPAWDGNRNAVLDSMKKFLWQQIDKARARLARKAARVAAKIKAGV